jgi:hypothetical protein
MKTPLLALTLVASATFAHATPGDQLSGGGTRDWGIYHSSFVGNLKHNADGTLTGNYTIVTDNDGDETAWCRFLRFRPIQIANKSWIFEGWGQCYRLSTGYYQVHNRFVIIDYGTPGAGVDYIDVNYYGAVGPSVPGGFIQTGDLISTP